MINRTMTPDPTKPEGEAPSAETPEQTAPNPELVQLVEHINAATRRNEGVFQKIQNFLTQLDERLKQLEGASPHDRIVSAAIAARVEGEALYKAAQMAKSMVSETLAKLEAATKPGSQAPGKSD